MLKHADAITVIRQGKTVGEIADPSAVTSHDLAELMVGSELPTPETRESTVTDIVALELTGLTVASTDSGGRNVVDDVSFAVHRGEIVGIAGVEGNGQSELVEAIVGLSGGVRCRSASTVWTSPPCRHASDATSGSATSPRIARRTAWSCRSPLWENAALGHQHAAPYAKGPWMNVAGARTQTELIVDEFDVRTPGIDVPAFTLSGGNQQKLVVGREMTAEPKLLVAAHPTRGVDVGAQAVIWDILRDARAAGLGTVLISADLEELIGLSDRLLVMLRGRVVAEVDPATVTPAELGSYMTGATAGAH